MKTERTAERQVNIPNLLKSNSLILKEVIQFPRLASIALTCNILGSALEASTIGLIAAFLQGLTNPLEPPITTGVNFFDVWFLASNATPTERVLRLSFILILLVWLRSLFNYLGASYSRITELKILDSFRRKLFEQFQSLQLSYYSDNRSSNLIDTITNQLNQIKLALTDFSNLIIRSLTLLAYSITMFVISWQLTIVNLLLYALLSVGLSYIVRKVREISFDVPKADSQALTVIVELLNGIRTVKASSAEDYERTKFYRASDKVVEVGTKLWKTHEMIKPIGEGAATTILVCVAVTSFLFLISNDSLKAASLLTFMFVLFRMMPLVSQVNTIRGRLGTYKGSIEAIRDLLRKDDKPYLKNGSKEFLGLTDSIEFVSVDFQYGIGKGILHSIDLRVPKGYTVALVGASGAGKTTLADLIPRFYDPTKGKILIDGVDLKELEVCSLRRRMAIVSQDTFIFNTTVRNNISYSLSYVEEAKLIEATSLANALDFIQELPEGFNTILGDRGVRLSGGQRQRIAIARALLRDPEILILDEATSALDSATEKMIQASIEKLSAGRTVITIAHRLSTISSADMVIVLEAGRIVEAGKYQELLKKRGELWKYHKIQHENN